MDSRLNILLFGQGHAGSMALAELCKNGHRVVGCVTSPTSAQWEPSLVAQCAAAGVPCWTDPARVKGVTSMAKRPDVVLSVGYRRRIEMPFLGLGRIGGFNVAGSQLPRYRGCFPFRWAILNGETAWGVTVHQMTPRYCDGAVLHRRAMVVRAEENAFEFERRCGEAMAGAAVEAVNKLAGGVYSLCSLESPSSVWFDRGIPHGGLIDWNQPAGRVDAFVRAMDFGRPNGDGGYEHLTVPAMARIGGREVGVWRTRFGGTMSVYPPGTITRCDEQVWVQCTRGHLAIDRIFVEGEDHQAAGYFERVGLGAGDRFDTTHFWATPGKVQTAIREVSHAA